MKIEEIKYSLPTTPVEDENFDKEKWLKENPIDYFKFIYLMLTTPNNAPKGIPCEIVTSVVFEALYPVIRLYIPNTLYKFCSLDDNEKLNKKKFKTLENKQIFMSSIKDFNDPFDCKASFYDSNQLARIKGLEHVGGKFIDDFTAFYLGTALTANDTNCMPMWAHYSNNHQGFCVSYDMKNSENTELAGCTFPVQYTNERLDITSFMKKYANMVLSEIDKQTSQGKKQIGIYDLSLIYMQLYLCNIKHLSWQYEKEFRCTMAVKAKGMPYVNAVPKSIYIGMNCSDKNKKELIKIAKKLSIPIYQMRFNEISADYSLEQIELKY